MFRLLKALPLTLALASLCFFAASCGSGNGQAQIRVINSIPDDQQSLDINFNGTKIITAQAFDTVQPTQTTPASYLKVASGSDTIEAFNTGTTTSPVVNSTSASLSGGTKYTILLGGFLNNSPQAFLMTDNNTAPAAGNIAIRIIDGSAVAGQNGLDVSIYQTGTQPPNPQVTGLPLGQASSYLPLTFQSSYSIQVYLHGNGNPLFNFNFPQNTGQITTLVIVDTPGGLAISPTPLVMNDLN